MKQREMFFKKELSNTIVYFFQWLPLRWYKFYSLFLPDQDLQEYKDRVDLNLIFKDIPEQDFIRKKFLETATGNNT